MSIACQRTTGHSSYRLKQMPATFTTKYLREPAIAEAARYRDCDHARQRQDARACGSRGRASSIDDNAECADETIAIVGPPRPDRP
jgi:hypothetical protein